VFFYHQKYHKFLIKIIAAYPYPIILFIGVCILFLLHVIWLLTLKGKEGKPMPTMKKAKGKKVVKKTAKKGAKKPAKRKAAVKKVVKKVVKKAAKKKK
jgi:hypothetical protein